MESIAVRPVGFMEQRRRAFGLRQVDLAKQAGVSRTTIGLAERGYIPGSLVQAAIAEVLDTDPAHLWPNNDERQLPQAGAVKTAEEPTEPAHDDGL